MKIKIEKIESNPFRPKDAPLDEERIIRLESTIKSSKFWKNVAVRVHPTKPGKFQLAYGHHRLEVLKRLGKTREDFIVLKLDDETMLKMMAQENGDWGSSVKFRMDMVKITYDFLKERGRLKGSEIKMLSEFLTWTEHAITIILAQLRATGQIEETKGNKVFQVEKKLLESMPNTSFAEIFRKTSSQLKASSDIQEKIAKRLLVDHSKPMNDPTRFRTGNSAGMDYVKRQIVQEFGAKKEKTIHELALELNEVNVSLEVLERKIGGFVLKVKGYKKQDVNLNISSIKLRIVNLLNSLKGLWKVFDGDIGEIKRIEGGKDVK
jgi:ParB-like chromosome segregation protein Spo0J